MKVSVRVIRDSWNSYPKDEIEFKISEETISFSIKEDDHNERDIELDRAELMVLLRVLEQ